MVSVDLFKILIVEERYFFLMEIYLFDLGKNVLKEVGGYIIDIFLVIILYFICFILNMVKYFKI